MAIFYKAVRPDGFDFHSGSVDYASLCGTEETLPVKTTVDDPECCSRDVYHASTSKADTLIGGSWPCRLFEVEGSPVCEEENKRGFYTLRVIRELPSWEALGPNGQEVAALIEAAKSVTASQAQALYAAWGAARGAARGAAWGAARGAAWGAAWDAAWDAARGAARGAAWGAAWGAVRDAARDAARALVVKDLISEENFNILVGPWLSVMGGADSE